MHYDVIPNYFSFFVKGQNSMLCQTDTSDIDLVTITGG